MALNPFPPRGAPHPPTEPHQRLEEGSVRSDRRDGSQNRWSAFVLLLALAIIVAVVILA